jgi:beta-lactamase class C
LTKPGSSLIKTLVKNSLATKKGIKLISKFLLLISLGLGVINTSISPALAKKNPSDGQKILSLVKAFQTKLEGQIPGLQGGAIAIVYQGQVIYQKVFGYQHNKTGIMTPQVLFPLASVSKPVAATIVAKLVREGKVSLNDFVKTSVPGIACDVQLKHLLSHSSGYVVNPNQWIEQGLKRQEVIRNCWKTKPIHQPGQVYSYNNLLYSLIEEMIFHSTNISWQTHLAHLWQDLHVSSYATCSVPEHVHIASPHSKHDKSGLKMLRRIPANYPQCVCSSAGVFASLQGMIQFLKLHLGYYSHILSSQDLAPFHQPQVAAPEIFSLWSIKWPFKPQSMKSSYGLGWRILDMVGDPTFEKRLVFHGGYLKGIGSFIGFLPSYDLGIVILGNQDSSWALQSGLDFWAEIIKAC